MRQVIISDFREMFVREAEMGQFLFFIIWLLTKMI